MAGGVGSRFWPLSKQKYPKQFLDVLGTGKSLFQATYERFEQLCPKENIFVVANQDYDSIIRTQIPTINSDQILLEPMTRNTAPCIAYAAYKIFQADENATMVVAPSDHLILSEIRFIETLNKAMDFASDKDVLVTLGIKPNRPDTGYGYIQKNEEKKDGDLFKVKTFTEKPNLELAKSFVESGEFLWNAGIFVWNAKSIIKAFDQNLPDVVKSFESHQKSFFTADEPKFIQNAYTTCPTISIDYGIMEKAHNVYVLPGDFGWSDIGTWNSIFEFLQKDENNNAIRGKYVFVRNAKNCIINVSDRKLLAVNNVENLIILRSQGKPR